MMINLIKDSLIAGVIALVISLLIILIIHSFFAPTQDLGWTIRAVVFTSFFSASFSWFFSARDKGGF